MANSTDLLCLTFLGAATTVHDMPRVLATRKCPTDCPQDLVVINPKPSGVCEKKYGAPAASAMVLFSDVHNFGSFLF
jgi:hypothetical protein